MSKDEIISKLQRLFSQHDPLLEEAHVVYFMVEARKIIDEHDKSVARFPLLKFYADWTAHTQKDKITPEIEQMAEEMYGYAVRVINAPHGIVDEKSKALEFAYMESLSSEVGTFLVEAGVNTDLATNKDKWTMFASLLVKVLENQPINNPSANVRCIIFEPASPRCVALRIDFKVPVNGNHWYAMKNAY